MSSYNHFSLESTSLELKLIIYLFSTQSFNCSFKHTSVWKALLLASVNVTEADLSELSWLQTNLVRITFKDNGRFYTRGRIIRPDE